MGAFASSKHLGFSILLCTRLPSSDSKDARLHPQTSYESPVGLGTPNVATPRGHSYVVPPGEATLMTGQYLLASKTSANAMAATISIVIIRAVWGHPASAARSIAWIRRSRHCRPVLRR